MIDDDFKVYLIEINTNPSLDICSTLLARLIPNMIDNMLQYYNLFRIAIDPIFPPPNFDLWTGGRKDSIPKNLM